MMFFVYTHILNQHHNFVNSFIYKLPVICIFMQIDTAKFVADKQKSRRQNVYDLENTLCCLHKIDDIENNAFTRFFALQQIIAMLFSFSLFSKDYLYITINITLRYA